MQNMSECVREIPYSNLEFLEKPAPDEPPVPLSGTGFSTGFRILGTVEATSRGRNVPLGPARQRCTLAALLVDAGRPVPVSTLIDRVWDECPPSGVRSVMYTYIARLRRVLASFAPGTQLIKDASGYRLAIDPDQVDLHRARSLLSSSHTAPDAGVQRSLLSEAVALWTGEPLAGITSRWAERFRESLRPFKDEVLCAWADCQLRVGDASPVIKCLTNELLESPLSEHLHERLIRALYFGGQRAQALEHYGRLRRRLVEELGTDPSIQLRELHQSILRGDLSADRPADDDMHRTMARLSPPLSPPGPPALSSMPLDVDDFSGRGEEISRLHSLFTKPDRTRPPLAVITGAAGVGKTALALRLAHQLAPHFPGGQLFVSASLQDGDKEHPLDLADCLLRALQEDPVLSSASERAMRLRLRLANRRILVVLDDVHDDAALTSLFPNNPECGLIVVSRHRPYLPGAELVHLGELSQAEAIQMLRRAIGHARVDEDLASAEQLVSMCDGLPLALRALAARLITRPPRPLRELVDKMADPAQRLQEIRYGSLDVLKGFDQAYGSVDARSARLFSRLGSLSWTDWFSAEQAKALVDSEDISKVRTLLDRLADNHLIRICEESGARYRFGELQYLYARYVVAPEAEHVF